MFHPCELGDQLWLRSFFLNSFLFETPALWLGVARCICLLHTAPHSPFLPKRGLDLPDNLAALVQRALCWSRDTQTKERASPFCLYQRRMSHQLRPALRAPAVPEQNGAVLRVVRSDSVILPSVGEVSRNFGENHYKKLL